MDDKLLLEAISQMMAQQKQELKTELRQEIMHDMKILLDTDVQTRFNLLAENLDILKEKLLGADDLETLQDQLDLQYAMLRKHTKEIAELKKAN